MSIEVSLMKICGECLPKNGYDCNFCNSKLKLVWDARQPEIDAMKAKWDSLDKLTTEQHGKIKLLESQVVINKINTYAFENLTRKLNEANSRIVEFEDIKKGHLAFIKEKNKEIDDLKQKIKEQK